MTVFTPLFFALLPLFPFGSLFAFFFRKGDSGDRHGGRDLQRKQIGHQMIALTAD